MRPRKLGLELAQVGRLHEDGEHFWVDIAGKGDPFDAPVVLAGAAGSEELAKVGLYLVLVGRLPEDEWILGVLVLPGRKSVSAESV